MIDLHSHTTASDGSLSPGELVRLAKETGISILGITDHDTIDGISEALVEAETLGGVEIIPGVEFSTEYPPGTMHILGYLVDIDHPELVDCFSHLVHDRNSRLEKMVSQLRATGIDITLDEVYQVSNGTSFGRPHVAQVLIQKGIVKSVDEGFTHWLTKGKPGFVPQPKIEPAKAIEIILKAGGVPVLAHPYQLKPDSDAHLESIVKELTSFGLKGIEAWYSLHTPEMTETYQAIASRNGLICTGGSDFHGKPKPNIRLGTGTGGLKVPEQVVHDLKLNAVRL